MKILMFATALGPVYGGPSRTVIDVAKSLNKQDVFVDIVSTSANGSESLDVPLQQWIEKTHYRIQYFPYFSWGDYKWSNSLRSWLFRHVFDYDLVHINAVFTLPSISAYQACKKHKIPYVVTPHGMLEPWALAYKSWKKRLYYNLIERDALKNADALQALASPEANNIQKLQPKTTISVIPNGIHVDEFSSPVNAEEFYRNFPNTKDKDIILFLGRIDPKKGLDLLAKAFSTIHKKFPKSHLVIAGPDNVNFLPKVQQYLASESCLNETTFTGMITGSLKYSALSAASVYVAPSYSEGFSMSILEGMASGLPCIITTGCNFPEAGDASAAYIVSTDAQSISEALMQCLSNPEQSLEMGKRAKKLILEQYSWNMIAIQLKEFYQEILTRDSLVFQKS